MYRSAGGFNNHVVILGWNETGFELAEHFREQRKDVVVVDLDYKLHAAFKFSYKGVATQREMRCPNMEYTHKLAYYYTQAFHLRKYGQTYLDIWQETKNLMAKGRREEAMSQLYHEGSLGSEDSIYKGEMIYKKMERRGFGARVSMPNLPGSEDVDKDVLNKLTYLTRRDSLLRRHSAKSLKERKPAGPAGEGAAVGGRGTSMQRNAHGLLLDDVPEMDEGVGEGEGVRG